MEYLSKDDLLEDVHFFQINFCLKRRNSAYLLFQFISLNSGNLENEDMNIYNTFTVTVVVGNEPRY